MLANATRLQERVEVRPLWSPTSLPIPPTPGRPLGATAAGPPGGLMTTDTKTALSAPIAQAVREAKDAFEQIENLAICLSMNLTDAVRRDYQARLERAIRKAVQKADAFIVSV